MADIKPIDEMPPQTERLPTPYASVPYSPVGFGAATGAGVQQVADVASSIYAHEREKAVASQALMAESDIENAKNQQIIAFGQLKGANAGTQAQQYLDNITKMRQQRLAQIQDPQVKRLAEMRTYSTVAQANLHIGQHVAQQNNVAAEESFNAKSATALTSVALAGPNPVLRQAALDDMQGVLLAEGLRQGLTGSPDDPKTPMGDFFARWHGTAAKTAVDSMLGQNLIPQAQAYMALPGVRESLARLGPTQLEAIDNRIRTHAETQGAVTTAFGLIAKYTTPGTTLFNEQAALKEASGMQVSPEQKLKTLDLIEQQAGRMKGAQAQKNATVFEQARSIYEKTHTLTPADPQQAAVMSNAQAYLLNPANQATGLWENLRLRAQMDMRRDATDPPTEDERKAAVAIGWDMATNPSRYLNMTPETFNANVWDKVAPRDFPRLGNQFDALQKRVGTLAGQVEKGVPPQIDAMLIKIGRGSGVFPTGNLPPAKWSTQDQVDLYYAAREAVAQGAAQITRMTGKPPTQADYEKLINDEFIKGHVTGGGRLFGDSFEKTRIEAQQDPRYIGKPFVANIPADTRASLIQSFNKRGVKAPTEAQVQAAYRAMPAVPTSAAAALPMSPADVGGAP